MFTALLAAFAVDDKHSIIARKSISTNANWENLPVFIPHPPRRNQLLLQFRYNHSTLSWKYPCANIEKRWQENAFSSVVFSGFFGSLYKVINRAPGERYWNFWRRGENRCSFALVVMLLTFGTMRYGKRK
jgi:hypothetical protein